MKLFCYCACRGPLLLFDIARAVLMHIGGNRGPLGMNDGVNFSRQQQESNQESNPEFEYCLDDILASANFEPDPREAHASTTTASHKSSIQEAADALRNEPPSDRRKRRRALISASVRVRGINVTDAVVDEISTTIDVSRAGILFLSTSPNYARGMEVAVMFPYSSAPAALHAEQQGRIVRALGTSDGRYAVAVALGEGIGEDIVDSCGRKIADSSLAPRMPSHRRLRRFVERLSVLALERRSKFQTPARAGGGRGRNDPRHVERLSRQRRLRSDGGEQLSRRARSVEYVHARAGDRGSGRRGPARL